MLCKPRMTVYCKIDIEMSVRNDICTLRLFVESKFEIMIYTYKTAIG